MELHRLSLTGMLQALHAGRCSVVEIWRACLLQVERHDPTVRAWAHPLAPEALLGALQTEADVLTRLPLRGLPLGVKDTIDVAGLPAERGSPIWRGRVATEDAACVSALKAAGARVMGKTVTTEFAYFTPGPTTNPHAATHTPGGSSSGSAAAVAAAMVPVALGSQTAASVIRPASYCGVAAYVASVGATSLRGVLPLAHSLDSLGVLARDVADLQLLREALQRAAPAPGSAAAPIALLAVDGTAFGAVDDDMLQAFESALQALAARGIGIRRGPPGWGAWPALHRELMAYEAAQTLAFEADVAAAALSPALRELIAQGRALTADDHARLLHRRHASRALLEQALQGCNAVITPAATGQAPAGLAATGRPDLSRAWQLFGLPQVALPFATGRDGLPLGIQLVGRRGGDGELLRWARWLQQQLGWSACEPAALVAAAAGDRTTGRAGCVDTGKPESCADANGTVVVANGMVSASGTDHHSPHSVRPGAPR